MARLTYALSKPILRAHFDSCYNTSAVPSKRKKKKKEDQKKKNSKNKKKKKK
jgi:hypothetical protein